MFKIDPTKCSALWTRTRVWLFFELLEDSFVMELAGQVKKILPLPIWEIGGW